MNFPSLPDISQLALHAEQRDRERASLAFLGVIKDLREKNAELLLMAQKCMDWYRTIPDSHWPQFAKDARTIISKTKSP